MTSVQVWILMFVTKIAMSKYMYNNIAWFYLRLRVDIKYLWLYFINLNVG